MPSKAPISTGHTFAAGDTIDAATLNKAFEQAQAIIPDFAIGGGGTGATTAKGALLNLGAVGYLSAWVVFGNNGTPVSMGTLPARSIILDTQIATSVAFNDTGTDEGIIGTTADDDAFGLATSIAAVGKVYPAHGVDVGYVASSVEVFAEYNGGNGNAATGKACFILTYAQVAAEPS